MDEAKGVAAKYANWIQFIMLLVYLLVMALHMEGRISKLEQQINDGDKNRVELMDRLARIENKLDRIATRR